MNVSVTNRVYTAKAWPEPELQSISHINYTPPKGRFSAGILRNCPCTLLIFPTGSVVINKCKTLEDAEQSIVTCAEEIGCFLTDLKLVNIVGCLKIGKPINLIQLHQNTPSSILEPELHCGLLYYIDNVSVIVYHTGTIMFAGCKSEEQYASVVEALSQKFNK